MRNSQNVLILDNIRSSHNVGSIFRTADALGISKIYLVGYTPKPIDRFGRVAPEITKTALGAEKTIPWEAVASTEEIINILKKEKFQIIALEQSSKSVDYKKVKIKNRSVIILGNEVLGIDKKILSLCDIIAEIPMDGKKESLNVAVAFGVAGFRMLSK